MMFSSTFIYCASAQLFIDPINEIGLREFDPVSFAEEQYQNTTRSKRAGQLLRDENDEHAGPEIHNPDLCDNSVKQYSGFIPFSGYNKSKKKFFFWMFESRNNPAKDPVVLWLTGGPGCSSMMALLKENGPCNINTDGKVEKNPSSWNNKANVVWVDQPAGTGFSEGQWVTDEEGVQEDMYAFLLGFFDALPQFKDKPFYITGESYAGHYVPSIAHRVWKGNNNKEGAHINLAGIAIGNGLTDASEQYKWYPEMAEDGGKNEGGSLEKGVISGLALQFMKAAVHPCVEAVNACNGPDANLGSCQEALVICNVGLMLPYQATGMNVYDMRIKCEVPPLCYDFSKVTDFLNDPKTQKALGVDAKWQECNQLVNKGFMGDFMKNFHQQIPDLLHDNIPVVVYAGDVDYICNWLGNKAWTLLLEWKGNKEFNEAKDIEFKVDGEKAGRYRSAQKFSFVQIYQAGHMVPMDKPKVASVMINEIIKGGKLFSSVDHTVESNPNEEQYDNLTEMEIYA